MIYKKIITNNVKYFTDLILQPYFTCCDCSDPARITEGLLRLQVLSASQIEVEDREDAIRVTIHSDDKVHTHIVWLYNTNLVHMINYNGIIGEPSDRILEDKTSAHMGNFHEHYGMDTPLSRIALPSYLNTDNDYVICPDCGSTDCNTPAFSIGHQVGASIPHVREGFFDNKEMGITIGDASILLSNIDAEFNTTEVPLKNSLFIHSDYLDSFNGFMATVGTPNNE